MWFDLRKLKPAPCFLTGIQYLGRSHLHVHHAASCISPWSSHGTCHTVSLVVWGIPLLELRSIADNNLIISYIIEHKIAFIVLFLSCVPSEQPCDVGLTQDHWMSFACSTIACKWTISFHFLCPSAKEQRKYLAIHYLEVALLLSYFTILANENRTAFDSLSAVTCTGNEPKESNATHTQKNKSPR